ncbi:hypothetical protein ITJ38_17830 [Agreia pratensis]|uniref:hypothetical protein n=1 Tax=Agreia pratensis TaxID=150121 RepID=UPI00188C1872|nr:hypothetical protein [Agreia pratensis]MBF4636275.1 hypothetical protein [Agreia pratensis]
MFRTLRGQDASIEPWEWISEASPFANEGDGAYQATAWARTMVYYSAWAGSVGRPVLTIEDLDRGGIRDPLLTEACEAVLTFPSPTWPLAPDELARQNESKLREALATYQMQVLAAGFLESNGTRPPGFSTSWDVSTQINEVAIAHELEKRGLRS